MKKNSSITVSNTNTFTMPASNVTVNVTFVKKTLEDIAVDELFKNAKALETTTNLTLDTKSEPDKDFNILLTKINESFKDRIKGTYLESVIAATSSSANYSGTTLNITYVITYHHTKEQEAAVNEYVDAFINSNINNDMSDYEKIKAVHDYIVTNAAYVALNKIDETTVSIPEKNPSGISVHSPYALSNNDNEKNIGVCQAYAGLFQKFMDMLDIECYYVTGTTNEPHAWNIVNVEGKYYNVDLTYDDPIDGGRDITEQDPPKSGLEGYDFFLKGNVSFGKSHLRKSLTEIAVDDADYSGAPTGKLGQ